MPPAELTVTVVIPAHDAEAFVAEAVASALAEAHRPLEAIVVDDGSTDGTAAAAARAGARVVARPNGGIGAARNTGIAHASGELIAFLDADDLFAPGGLDSRVAVLAERPGADLVFGLSQRFTADGPFGEPQPCHIPGAMVVRRAALDRVGPFREGTVVSEGLDWLLRAREARLGEVTLGAVVHRRRIHGANNSLLHRGEIGEFARTLKASLDRRRAAG